MTLPVYFELVNDPNAKKKTIGTLHISTGKIVACDPLVEPDAPAFERTTPTGDFVVETYLSKYDENGLACLRFSSNTVVRWEMATVTGQDLTTLQDNQIFGYGVDAGLGCFMDLEGAEAMLEHEEELIAEFGSEYTSYYDYGIGKVMLETGEYESVNFKPYADNPHNIIIFSSGCGDGFYGAYWGFDANGQLVCLVTDFSVLGY